MQGKKLVSLMIILFSPRLSYGVNKDYSVIQDTLKIGPKYSRTRSFWSHWDLCILTDIFKDGYNEVKCF